MDFKKLKNLSSPKYRIAMGSVALIGTGAIYLSLSNFFGSGEATSDSDTTSTDDRVRLDSTIASRGIKKPTVDDYKGEGNTEIARVYEKKRDDEKSQALSGDGSYVLTLGSNMQKDGDDFVKTTTTSSSDKSSRIKAALEEMKKSKAEETVSPKTKITDDEVDVEGPDTGLSFQEQLEATKEKQRSVSKPLASDLSRSMENQRQIYRKTQVKEPQAAAYTSQDLSRADFIYDGDMDDGMLEVGQLSIGSYDHETLGDVSVPQSSATQSQTSKTPVTSKEYSEYLGVSTYETKNNGISISPGEIFYTRLQIGINTDEPSPVRAQILSGPLAGAVLLGNPVRTGKKAMIQLSTMTYDGKDYDIDAVALDLETKRTGLADDVDNHYVRNIGYLTLASILSGYAGSLQSWEEEDSTSSGITTTSKQSLDDFDDRVMVGIGEAGMEVKSILRDQINREPTVHVYPKDIGIMFMSRLDI